MWWKRRTPEQAALSDLQRRLQRLSTHDLLTWSETLQFQLGRSLSQWSRNGESPALLTAQENAGALRDLVDEIVRRSSTP